SQGPTIWQRSDSRQGYAVQVTRRLATVAGAFLLLTAPAHGSTRPFPRFGSGCARSDFKSSVGAIRAERCGPASGPRAAAVLHGCGGFSTFDHQLAVDLPRFGISTLYLDYCAPRPPSGSRGYCSFGHADRSLFGLWEQAAAGAATFLRRRYAHVGAVGWSLGAGVAIATA